MEYDAIIIGAGIGTQQHLPGGFAKAFARKGFISGLDAANLALKYLK